MSAFTYSVLFGETVDTVTMESGFTETVYVYAPSFSSGVMTDIFLK